MKDPSGIPAKGLPGEPAGRPLVESPRPEALIEPDRSLVPVEDGPFHSAASPLVREPGEVQDERTADSAAAASRHDEDILEVEAGTGQKRGVSREEYRETRRFPLVERKDTLRGGPPVLRKERLAQAGLRRLDLVGQLLVFGEAADERKDDGGIGEGGGSDCHGRATQIGRPRGCNHSA